MGIRLLWLAGVLLAGITCGEMAVAEPAAQPPGKKGGPPDKGKGKKGKGPGSGRPVTVDDMVDRIMAYDTDDYGFVTKDQLPDRMQHLFDLGDTNQDGALEPDEIKALAAKLANDKSRGGFAGPNGKGPGGKGPGGKGPGGKGGPDGKGGKGGKGPPGKGGGFGGG